MILRRAGRLHNNNSVFVSRVGIRQECTRVKFGWRLPPRVVWGMCLLRIQIHALHNYYQHISRTRLGQGTGKSQAVNGDTVAVLQYIPNKKKCWILMRLTYANPDGDRLARRIKTELTKTKVEQIN